MKRFVWKVVSLMMLVSILPLLSAGLFINNLFQRALTEGFREEVRGSLDSAGTIYRSNIGLRRQLMQAQSDQLAGDVELRGLLAAEEVDVPAVRQLLDGRARRFEQDDHALAAVALVPATVDPGEWGEQAPAALVDRRGEFPAERWRAKEVTAPVVDARGRAWTVRSTFVAPWATFDTFERLGKVQKFYQTADAQQAELTTAYTKTFFAMSGAVLLVTLIVALLLARATTRPLRLLSEAAGRVGRGELDVQVPVHGRDEIAQLTTAFNQMVVELGQARVRLTYLERVSAWQEIARRLAHEIKNPLTPILLAVQQLDRKFDDYLERPQRFRQLLTDALEIVTEEVESLRTLVREFSDFARLPEVSPERTCVADFVTDLLRTNPQYEGKVVALEDGSARALAGVDATMMRRVLINLVDNAVDAAHGEPDGSGAGVKVGVEAVGDMVVIAVEDRGQGVPAGDLERIFEPYYTTKAGGTGLGLAIVRKIVIDHGGDIVVRSPVEAERGTRMEVRLPRMAHVVVALLLAAAWVGCAEVPEEQPGPGPWSADDVRRAADSGGPAADASEPADVGQQDDAPQDAPEEVGLDARPDADADAEPADADAADVAPDPPPIAESRVIYLVLPDRFANGDPGNDRTADPACFDPAHTRRFHGGDLAGLTAHLDYLDALGVGAIWSTPLYAQVGLRGESCGYHGYWPDLRDPDDRAIEPRLGTDADLDRLLAAMDARSMGFILDMVVNHAGYGAALTGTHPDWFHGSDCASLGAPDVYCALAGLPDLAQEDPRVASYLDALSAGWVRRFPIAGVRMDTVKHVPVSYFGERWVPAVRAVRPDLFLVGEYLSDQSLELYAPYLDAGFDSMFNFRLRTALVTSFAEGRELAALADAVHEVITRFGLPRALRMTNLLDNHDLPRYTESLTGSPAQKVRRYHLALTALMTLVGIPQLTYGDELGMLGGGDPDNRRDLPAWAFDAAGRRRASADGFIGDPSQTWDHVAALTAIRARRPALQRGAHYELWRPSPGGPAIYAFLRYVDGDHVLVIFNNGASPSGPFHLPIAGRDHLPPAQRAALGDGAVLTDLLGTLPAPLPVANGELVLDLPALSAAVFAVTPP